MTQTTESPEFPGRFKRMEKYQFEDEFGTPLDAHFEVEKGTLFLLSRGGAIGHPQARNTEYQKALRLLLKRVD